MYDTDGKQTKGAAMEREKRLWGSYAVLYQDAYCKIKYLYIEPGAQISYQYHLHRTEDWAIDSGCARFVLDGRAQPLKPGDRVRILPGQLHTVKNTGDGLLIIHEIQTGDQLEETDIVRCPLPENL